MAFEADHVQWKASTGTRTLHDPGRLLRGSALEPALRWLTLHPDQLSHEVAEFIHLSDRAQHQRLTRGRRRVRLLAFLLALAVGLGL